MTRPARAAPLIAGRPYAPWGYVATGAIISAFAAWGLVHLGGFSWGWDESVLLMTGRQLQRGAPLYTSIWYNYPPLFPRMLATTFDLLGPSAAAGRGMVLVLSVLLLSGVAAIGYLLSRGWFAALAAMLFLVLSPPFLQSSRAVFADLPALSLATWAVALAYRNLARPQPGWIIGAGILYGLSLAIKPTSVFAGLPLLIGAWWPNRGSAPSEARSMPRGVGLLVIGTFVSVAISMAGTHLGALASQMLDSLPPQTSSVDLQIGENALKMLHYLAFTGHPGPRYIIPLLLIPGIASLATDRRRPERFILLSWWGAGVLTWLIYDPLYSHHLITLLAPSALVAACGVAALVRWTRARLRLPEWALATLALLLVAWVAGAGRLATHSATYALPADDDEDEDSLHLAIALTEMIPSEGYFVTDDLMLAFVADRQVPPELINSSTLRIKTGQLTADQAIAWTKAYGVDVIVFGADRLESLDGYLTWVQDHYRLERVYGRERRVYVPYLPASEATAITFGGELVLEGYDLVAPTPERPILDLTLHWRTLALLSDNQDLRIEIVDDQGQTRMTLNTMVAPSTLEPKRWREQDRAVISYSLDAAALAAGTYHVALTLVTDGVLMVPTDTSGAPIGGPQAFLPTPFALAPR